MKELTAHLQLLKLCRPKSRQLPPGEAGSVTEKKSWSSSFTFNTGKLQGCNNKLRTLIRLTSFSQLNDLKNIASILTEITGHNYSTLSKLSSFKSQIYNYPIVTKCIIIIKTLIFFTFKRYFPCVVIILLSPHVLTLPTPLSSPGLLPISTDL